MTRKSRYFPLAFLVFLSMACGMTAPIPSSDGQLVVKLPTVTATPAPITSNLAESVFIVTAEKGLQIRPCPYKDDLTCPPYQRGFVQGDVVMGFCRHFEDGSIWLEFDGHKYAAVYFDGVYLMEGNCQ